MVDHNIFNDKGKSRPVKTQATLTSTKNKSTAFFPKRIKNVARDSVKILAIFALIEGILQIAAPQYKNLIGDREYTRGHPIAINQDGYRGSLVPVEKSSDEVRILALGDSTTFGTGVPAKSTWSAQLPNILPIQSTSINGGFPTIDLKQIRKAYQEVWSPYKPDKVIVMVSNNMVSFGWIRQDQPVSLPKNKYLNNNNQSFLNYWRMKIKRTYKQFALPSFLSINSQRGLYLFNLNNHNVDPKAPYGPMLAFNWKQADLPPNIADEAWDIFAEDLRQLHDTVEADGKELIVVYLPTRFMVFDNWFDNEKQVPKSRIALNPAIKIQEISQAIGISYLDATSVLREARHKIMAKTNSLEPMYILFDFSHMDANGHRAIAEALVPLIEQGETNP